MTKILIVDDSAFMRTLLKNIVTRLGKFEIYEASAGEQALKEFKKQNPDLVLLDIILPDISGEQVLSNIRKINTRSKVIMVTAVGQQPMIERCKKLGISGYIVKPFEDTKIVEMVKKTLKG